MIEEPGEKLKKLRQKLKLSFRDVEEASTKIAERRANEEFIVALSRLSDIENKGVTPSAYRMYSLAAIYGLDIGELMSWYGIDLSKIVADSEVILHKHTHLLKFRPSTTGSITAPLTLDPGIDLSQTVFLSRMIQRWGPLPLMLLHNRDLKNYLYGLVGSEDWSMHPLIPPNSLLVIDPAQTMIAGSGWATPEDRPLYFLETRDSYICGWCTLRQEQLTVQFHPNSGAEPLKFNSKVDVEVIGRVVCVAKSLEEAKRRRSAEA